MSRLGARHVRPRSLEPGLGARQVWFQDLTRVKAERSDMSAITLWNLDKEPNKVGWDLAAEDQRLGQTCLARVTRTQPVTRISLAKLG
jgi:hypothetical protein